MMPEPHELVSPDSPGKMRVPPTDNRSAAFLLIILAIALSMAGAVACADRSAPQPEASEELPAPTAFTPATSTPAISANSATPETTTGIPPTEAIATPFPPRAQGLTPAVGFPTPPDRNFFRLARELLPELGEVNPVVWDDSGPLQVGHRETLKLVDLEGSKLYESDFELRLVTPNAYWLVEDGLEVRQEDLERSAVEFEKTIYPLVTGAFGSEWKPGVDGDSHLYIINASLKGVGGYYSAADEYPKALRPVSNERESIYINSRYLPVGTDIYAQVLAHELQHAVHWNADRTEDTWVNEGLSELAVTIAGRSDLSALAFRRAGPTSLTIWPAGDIGGAENYGAASLFMHYLTEHYGGREDLRPLLSEPGDGIEGINSSLADAGYDTRFSEIFRDWAVANLLNEEQGRYGYSGLPAPFPIYRHLKAGEEMKSAIPQYAIEYVRLGSPSDPAILVFDGDTAAPLLPIDVGKGCWWSNSGDVIDSTLTARIDLRQAGSAALDYEIWFSIEEDWDFAYLEISEDGGETWTILETSLTSSEDPLQVSFGPGYTGSSDGWRDESVPLDRWAGQEIQVRFQYITDAAINDHGLCLRNIRVSTPGSGDFTPKGWTPRGFAWTNNLVRQDFMVQVVYEGDDGAPNRVLQVPLDESNRSEFRLDPDANARRVVAVIQSMAPSTRMGASYNLRLVEAE